MRPTALGMCLASVSIGCSSHAAPMATDLSAMQVDSTIVVGPVDTTDAHTRDAIRVANAAAAEVDTIIVTPDSIVLRVGQAVHLSDVVTIEARNQDGRPVQYFAPYLETTDRATAEYGERGLVGRRPGRTQLVISPFSMNPSLPTRDVKAIVTVIVIP